MLTTLFSLLGCKQDMTNKNTTPDPMQEYRWQVTESAPKEYVMKIISGYFEAADGYKKDIPSRAVLNKGWGTGRSWIGAGREEMPLPKRMEITWFSYREDTFYHGAFDLPVEKLQEMFRQTMTIPYVETTARYNVFTVGIAPQGFVTVWLTGGNHQWVIMTAQAEEVEGIPWSAVFENPEFTKEEIMKETIDEALNDAKGSPHINDPTYWQRLHSELYTYDIKIESPYTTYSIDAGFLNRTTHTYVSDEQNWTHSPLSMLTGISFEFFFPDRIPVVSIENINSDEMYAAFRHLSKQNNGPLRVVITVDGPLDTWDYTARLRVENDKESIEIKQFDYRPVSNASSLEQVKSNKNLMRYMNYPGKPATP